MPIWKASEIELWVIRDGRAAHVGAQLTTALKQATADWNEQAHESGAPRLVVREGTQTISHALQDGVSAVILRTDSWCPPGARDEEEGCYAHARQAITHLYVNADKTAIVEADVEVNGVRPQWRLPSGEADAAALRALLAHELGHVLGLDHSCGLQASRGAAAAEGLRSCGEPGARASIMYPDPLEKGRTFQVMPTVDALGSLKAIYGGQAPLNPTLAVPALAVAAIVIVIVIAAAGLAWRQSQRARARVAPH